ncbi:isoprenylcysteine carboxyl methyltransferase family protein [Mucilaginibacter aquaedulcis]|uniref:isoprenylcysteine carboxyl methyltransferase family protein n=1 Tax=Mucilaginibacter aquaedulcis TaxID=1187081 RepID=UPI0025B580A4|nr:isoprenylcysteine carboxylmethyltransferase family protein [Mucilaginibacter aquaedulcis]MDN3551151.1 isoprenylcysteine carboxylmethyltransferase family protein [Mucilaginibacter aquaedulcis]
MYFILFICFVVLQRLLELVVAKRNEKWARSQGATEYGQGHYPYIVLLHTLFIIALIIEYLFKSGSFSLSFMIAFLLLIMIKGWVISSLGRYWNTKILRIPNSVLVKKGFYKLFKHPNYFIVICEIIVIPMVFNLYVTAIIFTLLNALMLNVRIRAEEKAWAID